jgi:hypothetical protein
LCPETDDDAEARMDVEVNDYPTPGANDDHDPGHGRACNGAGPNYPSSLPVVQTTKCFAGAPVF